MPAWLSPELIAIVLFGVLGLAVWLRRPRAGGDAGAGAALERERAAHEETRAALSKAQGDWREAAANAARAPKLEEDLAEARARAHDAEKRLESLDASLRERTAAHQREIAALVAFKEEMTAQFKALSGEALAAQTETFTKSSKERLETLLNPLKTQIEKFETAFVEDGRRRAGQSESLKTMIEMLTQETGKTQETAENLARALKGSSKAQGNWGEMILKTILDKSGLREGEEYVAEKSHTLEDGARLRPDVIVNLPGGQKLVVDSKVSLTAFNDCVNCADEAERETAAKSHVASLRNHIRGLSGKDYSALHGGVDFVILFVPIEAALALAVQRDPEITGDAVENGVMIASPNTLLMALRTVHSLWRIEAQNQNARDIAERAGKLYEKFVGFVDDLEAVGATIQRAHAQYEKAHGKLRSGPGNLVRQTEMLKQLGARTSKQLPEAILAASDERDHIPGQIGPGQIWPRGAAQHPERVPGLDGADETADSYEALTDQEKQVAAAIAQDTDA